MYDYNPTCASTHMPVHISSRVGIQVYIHVHIYLVHPNWMVKLTQTYQPVEERRRLVLQESISTNTPRPPRMTGKQILSRYSYDPTLTVTDSRNNLNAQRRAGSNVDENRIQALLSHPRVKAFLMLDDSALLLLNANSASTSLDMSVASAMMYDQLVDMPELDATETEARG